MCDRIFSHKHLQPIYFKHAHISQLSDFIKDRTAFTFLAGDPFLQLLKPVALALLRVVRLAAGFLVRLGVVVGAAEAGLHGSRVRTIGDGGGRLASAVSRDCRSKALATAPHLNPTHVAHLSHSSTPKHTKKPPCAQQESQCARRLKEKSTRMGGLWGTKRSINRNSAVAWK